MISAKRLEKYFPGKGRAIRTLLEAYQYDDPDDTANALDGCLNGYGIEAIWGDSCRRPAAAYINMGETYATTLLYDYERGEWELTSWGDWVEYQERHGKRFD